MEDEEDGVKIPYKWIKKGCWVSERIKEMVWQLRIEFTVPVIEECWLDDGIVLYILLVGEGESRGLFKVDW